MSVLFKRHCQCNWYLSYINPTNADMTHWSGLCSLTQIFPGPLSGYKPFFLQEIHSTNNSFKYLMNDWYHPFVVMMGVVFYFDIWVFRLSKSLLYQSLAPNCWLGYKFPPNPLLIMGGEDYRSELWRRHRTFVSRPALFCSQLDDKELLPRTSLIITYIGRIHYIYYQRMNYFLISNSPSLTSD